MFELVTVIFIFTSDEDIQLHYQENNTLITRLSREVMHTQYEWLFINMIVTNKTNRLDVNQTSVVYTVSISSSRDTSMETVLFAYVTRPSTGSVLHRKSSSNITPWFQLKTSAFGM